MMENFSEPIFFSRATALRYRVEFTGESAAVVPRLDAAEFIYFDTNLSSLSRLEQHLSRLAENIFSQEVAQAESSPKIFNRADWGANESYRFTAEGKEVWPAKQSAVEKIIIHHTAGGSGQEDPQSTIRGIYYWHAKVLGWGDIGYNYLIDQEGNIYEGRYGGDGVIGGHTFNSETNTNYNVGSMGVSILGCFEESSGACPTTHDKNERIEQSLIELIASKSSLWNIDAEGTSQWQEKEVPNILGHRDVDQTFCPGSNIYDELATVRSKVKQASADSQNIPALRAEFIDHTMRETGFISDPQTVSIRFK